MIKSKLVNVINDNGFIQVSIEEIIDEILCGNKVTNIITDNKAEIEKYIESCNTYSKKPTITVITPNKTLEDMAEKWRIPKEYLGIDVIEYIIKKCKDETEIKRASDELLEYHKRDQLIILNVMIYLVDIMRENNVVWGIGRGSSVASFCLYLIGINKINPLQYDICYDEFFK